MGVWILSRIAVSRQQFVEKRREQPRGKEKIGEKRS